MPANTGRCTVSMTNPQWTAWNRANRNSPLNPHMKRVECGCRGFRARVAAQPEGKCSCGHDNRLHCR
ncbi:uncharacterized protein B0H64DRAFT_405193 [Chaetomium fimeti]|uniref:Uncharacterized protein n=1 Tax=Chaetomium fimeti TaxID=1854472 RepID=A0AAE0HCA7_9PEZI|nr:hypothetical protein B0H64DRAFT_405193 [Chaetomium fimeti]